MLIATRTRLLAEESYAARTLANGAERCQVPGPPGRGCHAARSGTPSGSLSTRLGRGRTGVPLRELVENRLQSVAQLGVDAKDVRRALDGAVGLRRGGERRNVLELVGGNLAADA